MVTKYFTIKPGFRHSLGYIIITAEDRADEIWAEVIIIFIDPATKTNTVRRCSEIFHKNPRFNITLDDFIQMQIEKSKGDFLYMILYKRYPHDAEPRLAYWSFELVPTTTWFILYLRASYPEVLTKITKVTANTDLTATIHSSRHIRFEKDDEDNEL